MAEIRDVYSLDFNADEFNAQLDAAIQRIEELNEAMEDSAASAEDLEGAQEGLIKALSKEASGIEGLNAKRNALVKTQETLTEGSVEFNSVSKEVTATNSKLATATATTTKAKQGLFKSLIAGARGMNGLKRAASGVFGIFRVLGLTNPIGLAITAITAAISIFGSFTKKTEEAKAKTVDLNKATDDIAASYTKESATLNNLFGALNEANKGRGDKKAIIAEIQSQYGSYIGNINLETAGQDELALAYRRASEAILDSVVARAKAAAQEQIISKVIELQIAAVKQQTALTKETQKAQEEFNKFSLDPENQFGKNIEELEEQKNAFNALNKAISDTETKSLRDELAGLNELFAEASKAVKAALVDAVDPSTLTGSLDQTRKAVTSTTKEVAGSLAALEAQLAKLERQLREGTNVGDTAALKAVIAKIETQRKLVEEARKKLADLQGIEEARRKRAELQGIEEAQKNIEKLGLLLEAELVQKVADLNQKAAEEELKAVGTAAQIAEQKRLIQLKLAKDIAEIEASESERRQAELKKALDLEVQNNSAAFALIESEEERKLALRIARLETQRNAEIRNAQATISDAVKQQEAVEAINKQFDAQRLELEKATQRAIINERIAATEATISALEKAGESVIDLRKEIAQLQQQLVELDKPIEITVNKEKAKKDFKELFGEILQLTQQITDATFDIFATLASNITQSLERAVSETETSLDNMRANSQNFNAQQLALEKQRLEELQQLKERAAEREKVIALAQITLNSLLAIAKAAAEGGAAAPFTIASTIIALIAGFAAARNAAGQAFFDGSEFVDKEGRHPRGRDKVPAMLNRGERVVTTDTNQKYYGSLSAIHNRVIPAEVMNSFTAAYQSGGIDSAINSLKGFGGQKIGTDINLSERLGANAVFVNVGSDFSRLEEKLQFIEEAILGLPKRMPQTQVHANARGIYKVVEKYISKKDYTKNRAK